MSVDLVEIIPWDTALARSTSKRSASGCSACRGKCDTTDVVEVDVDDPQMTMPNAMLCAVHANPPEEDE